MDLSNVMLSHYRLPKIRQQGIQLKEGAAEYKLEPSSDIGTAMSEILVRLNELFITDELSDKDLINYASAILDKLSENHSVMQQTNNNSAEQAILGDFLKALDDAVMDSSEAHQNQMMQILNNPQVAHGFARAVFNMLNINRNKS